MMKLLGKFSCWRHGHLRGKRVGEPKLARSTTGRTLTVQLFCCPRCGGNPHLRSVTARAAAKEKA